MREEAIPYNRWINPICLNSRGEIIDIENDSVLKKTLYSSTFLKGKLLETIIPENADRIITYDTWSEGLVLPTLAGLEIFSRSGKLIKSDDKTIFLRDGIAIDNSGIIYCIEKYYNGWLLVKLDSNGETIWQRTIMATAFTTKLYVSDNGDYILLTHGGYNGSSIVYDRAGRAISKINRCLSDAEFLDDRRLIASDNGSDWIIYDFLNNFNVTKSGKSPNHIIRFTVDSAKRYLITFSYQNNSTYILRLYKYKNFRLIGEKSFNCKDYEYYKYNPIWKIEDTKITLRFTNRLIELKINPII